MMQSAQNNPGKDHKDIAREALLWSVFLCALLPIPLFFICLAPFVGIFPGSIGGLLCITAFIIQVIWPPLGLGYLFRWGRRAGRTRWLWKSIRLQVAIWGYIVFWSLWVYSSLSPYLLPEEQQEKVAMNAMGKLWNVTYNYAVHHHGQWPVNLHELIKHHMWEGKDLFLSWGKTAKVREMNKGGDFGYCRPGKQFRRWLRKYKHPPVGHFPTQSRNWVILWTKEPFYGGIYMEFYIYGQSSPSKEIDLTKKLRMDGCYIYGGTGIFNKNDLLKALTRQHCGIERIR